ncbi:MAG: hypothetical protein AAF799_05105 [Myxococcota bacterium]
MSGNGREEAPSAIVRGQLDPPTLERVTRALECLATRPHYPEVDMSLLPVPRVKFRARDEVWAPDLLGAPPVVQGVVGELFRSVGVDWELAIWVESTELYAAHECRVVEHS